MAERLSCRAVRNAVEDLQFVVRAAALYGAQVCDGAAPPTAERHYWSRLLMDAPAVLSRVLLMLGGACVRQRRHLDARSRRLRMRVLQLELPLWAAD
jgi:hypothetical protein